MERLEFNKVLDRYLTENLISSEAYENLDEYQMYTIQELKRAYKRLNKTNETKIYG